MFDNYSSIPIFAVYIVGLCLLFIIVWSLLREAAKAEPDTRKKLVRIYAWVLIGTVAIVAGINYFDVPEKLFPSHYENEQLRQQMDEKISPFESADYQQPFDSQ